MTGGCAVILGPTGKNFAAGMSGGIAYVLDKEHTLYKRLNKSMVYAENVTEKHDIEELRRIIADYKTATGSELAKEILDDFEESVKCFKKIVPADYQKMLLAISEGEAKGLTYDEAVLEAFNVITLKA